MKRNVAMTGVAGYVAPRHLKAIKDTGNRLVAALDPHDSVGVLDSYFPAASYFSEFERFDRHLEKLRRGREENRVHYVSVCSPNHLHDAHVRLALRIEADAICEKPVVLNPWNLDALERLEEETGRRIFSVLQLRLDPALARLREGLANASGVGKRQVVLSYVTARGLWYRYSWKGDPAKSGGLASNIGIHFFDLLIWLFGGLERFEVHLQDQNRAAGFLELERAQVRWLLSVDASDLPFEARRTGRSTYRSISIDGEELEFAGGFEDLHTRVYQEILAGRGLGLGEARPAVEAAYAIRHAMAVDPRDRRHPWLVRPALAEAVGQ